MKSIPFYENVLNCSTEDDVFEYLIKTLKPSNMLWTYFVNWEKVFKNTSKIELALNTINHLIGKEDFDKEFKYLLKENNELANILPALVVRSSLKKVQYKILIDYRNRILVYEDFDFTHKKLKDEDIDKYLKFVKETGLKDLIVNRKIKNLVDYMIGVEAGLDSNGRKNRGGHAMEKIVEAFVADVCIKKDYQFLKEANAKKIQKEFDIEVPVDKSSRRYDFVINTGTRLVLMETNFYGGGGSKLKSTAGEYRNLFDVLNRKFQFIWVTDGPGWLKSMLPLRETFNHNDYVFNLEMLEKGILESVI